MFWGLRTRPRRPSRGEYALFSVIGVVTGYYIFDPIVKQMSTIDEKLSREQESAIHDKAQKEQ
jgi:hypothetical protein